MTDDRRDSPSPTLLWAKQHTGEVDAALMAFMAGDDIILDRELFVHDIEASRVHAAALASIGILKAQELAAITASLEALRAAYSSGDFVLDARYEDGHSAIEDWLTQQLGDLGAKIHTGRSRNDQVLVASRLYLRQALEEVQTRCAQLADICLRRAEADMLTPMPGYTHLQRAVVSSLGLWFAGFAEAFIDDVVLARDTRSWIDANPLGTAAGYGVSLPLDRNLSTRELGFARLQVNPIYAQNSRGRFELQALTALSQVLMDLRRVSWDLSLFAATEFDFLQLPDRYTTGSSIMPNKRNPDPIELLRAAPAPVLGAITELQSVLSLPSGYQRDLQLTKGPMVRGVTAGLQALRISVGLLADVDFDRPRMAQAISPEMYATDYAYELVAEGMPFRQAYREAAARTEESVARDPVASLQRRTSPGAPGQPLLETLRERLSALSDIGDEASLS
ncbi:MAG: argininosuccinate lyase [Pseudomonadota bacterium]